MSYIGNAPISAAFLTDTFSGTGSQTAFTMTVAPANTSSIIVAITGVLQDPSTYSVSGTTLTFSAAPPSGTSNISVRYLGIPASGVTTTAYRTVTNTTATAGQTSFTIPSYTVGYVDVYRNGVYLPTTDYTATTGTTVVLTNAATVGDTITTISFYVSSVLNAIPNVANSVARSNLPVGCILQVVQGSTTTVTTNATTTFADTALSASITPSSSTSKILVTLNGTVYGTSTGYNNTPEIALLRSSTILCYQTFINDGQGSTQGPTNGVGACITYLDSPATSSSITYKIQCRVTSTSYSASMKFGLNNGNSTLNTLTLMEIAA